MGRSGVVALPRSALGGAPVYPHAEQMSSALPLATVLACDRLRRLGARGSRPRRKPRLFVLDAPCRSRTRCSPRSPVQRAGDVRACAVPTPSRTGVGRSVVELALD